MFQPSMGYKPGDRPVVEADYELVEFLGAGQFGEVWSVIAPGGFRAAAKIIDLTRTEGELESKALEQLKGVCHPNLTPIHAAFTVDVKGHVVDSSGPAIRLIVAMGLGDKCLHKRLKECEACGEVGMPRDELLRYMDGTARGIDFLHRPVHDLGEGPTSIIHRDIKPHNILIVGGDAQVCDFGLAKAVENLQKSRTAMLVGTYCYMSPEVLLYNRPATVFSDQFSLAITYFELRTSALPFTESTEPSIADICIAHKEDKLNLSRLDPRERRVVKKAIEQDPANRFASCSEMVQELQAVCTPPPKPIPTPIPKPNPEPKHRWISLLILAAIPLILVGGILCLTPSELPEPPGIAGKIPGKFDDLRFDALLQENQFDEALGMLEDSPTLLSEEEKSIYLKLVRDKWSSEFQGRLKNHLYAEVVDMLTSLPLKIVEDKDEIEDLWQEARKSLLDRLRSLLVDKRFAEAFKFLDASPPKLIQGDITLLEDEVLTNWLSFFQEAWSNPDSDQRLKTVRDGTAELIERFPDCVDAKLIRARSLLKLGEYDEKTLDLLTMPDDSELLEDRCVLHLTLLLIAEYGHPTSETAVEDRLRELDQPWDGSAGDGFWDPDVEECNRIDQIRRELVNPLWGQIRDQLGAEQFAAALDTWQTADELSGGRIYKLELAMWRNIIRLYDPQSSTDDVGQALEEIKVLLESRPAGFPTPSQGGEISTALEKVAEKEHAAETLTEELKKAIELNRSLGNLFSFKRDIAHCSGPLWKARIAVRITEPAAPEQKEKEELSPDWESAEAAGFKSRLVNAWLAELLLEFPDDPDDPDEAHDRAFRDTYPGDEGHDIYVGYVRACALHAGALPFWDSILTELDILLPVLEQPEGALAVQGRVSKAASMVVEATTEKGKANVYPARVFTLANEKLSADESQQDYNRLKAVHDSVQADQVVLEPTRMQQLKLGLSLAAFLKPEADYGLAWSLSSELVRQSETDLGRDAVSVLGICVRSHLSLPEPPPRAAADQQTVIVACLRLLRLLKDDKQYANSLGDEGRAAFYKETLEPISSAASELAVAPQQTPAAEMEPAESEQFDAALAELEEFHAALGDFLRHYENVPWPFSEGKTTEDVAAKAEELYETAIRLEGLRSKAPDDDQRAKRLAEYYLNLGYARLALKKPKRTEALEDANKALEKNPDLRGAHGLLASVLLGQSRQSRSRDERLEHLDAAILEGEKAVADSSESEEPLSNCKLALSCAYLDRASCSDGPNLKLRREEDFAMAVDYAEQAATEWEGAYPHYPYLSLGMACEGLARLPGHDDSPSNYQKAVTAFTTAVQKTAENDYLASNARLSLGRCYYRAVTETGIEPALLGFENTDKVMAKCRDCLEEVVNYDHVKAEASYYLASVVHYQGDSEYADACFEQAKSVAGEQGLREAVDYFWLWARFPLSRAKLETEERHKEALARADQLEKVPSPPDGHLDPKQEADRIRADVHFGKAQTIFKKINDGEYVEVGERKQALETCTRELTQVLDIHKAVLPADLAEVTPKDIDWLLSRAEAYNLLLNKLTHEDEPRRLVADEAISNADRAAELATSPNQKFTALSHTVSARNFAYDDTPSHNEKRSYLIAAIDDIHEMIQLFPPPRSEARESRSLGANVLGTWWRDFQKEMREREGIPPGNSDKLLPMLTDEELGETIQHLSLAAKWQAEIVPMVGDGDRPAAEEFAKNLKALEHSAKAERDRRSKE